MDNFTAVLEWVRSHGAVVQGAQVASVPGAGRGLLLDAPVKEGQLLLRIPRHLMIAEQRLQAELAPLIAACPDLAEDDSLLMSAYLLVAAQHCGFHSNEPAATSEASSSWEVYLRSLPSLDELLGLPYLWQDADIDAAGLPSWSADVKESRAQVFGGDFKSMKKAFMGAYKHATQHKCSFPAGPRLSASVFLALREPTLLEYAWARACVSSRSFLDGGFMDEDFMFAEAAHMLPTAMIPAADMLNHCCDGATCTAEWKPSHSAAGDESQAAETQATGAGGSAVDYVLRSPCDLPRDTEVVISYGEKGGEDMLESHGFVPRAPKSAKCGGINPYQSVFLSLGPAVNTVQLPDCCELAPVANRTSTLEYFAELSPPLEITGSCSSILNAVGMFRLALCPPSALEGGAHPDAALHQVASAQHEAAVLRFMAEQLVQRCGIPAGVWSAAATACFEAAGVRADVCAGAAAAAGTATATAADADDSCAGAANVTVPSTNPTASQTKDAPEDAAAILRAHLPDASPVAQELLSELKHQRQAIAEHVLGFMLALQQACAALAGGADADSALVSLKQWLRAASGGEVEGDFGKLALPMWHSGDVQSLGEGYLGTLLAVAST